MLLGEEYTTVVVILLTPPPTQRYFTGAEAEGVSGELRYYDVQRGEGAEGVSGEDVQRGGG